MRLVQRLDGLPLAIEMAAAQLDTTTAGELADALDEGLYALRSSRRHAPARHRSLHDVLAWSEAHLDDTEAGILAALSIFAGPIVATDIEGVLEQPGVIDVVRTLTRRSLVNIDRSRTPARFYLLETIRAFARQRLASAGRTDELARRHAEWFADVTRAADAELRTAGEAAAQARVESIFAELRVARDWAFDHDLGLAAGLSAHLYLYAQARFVDEPLLWAEQLLDRVAADDPHRPVLLAAAATRLIRRGNIADARGLAHEAAERAGDTPYALPALDALTDAGLFDGRVDHSSTTARAMMQLARRHGDLHFQAIAGSGLALAAAYGGDPDPDAETALADLDQLPLSPSARGWVAYTRGELCHGRDSQQALIHYDDALREARKVNNRYLEGAAIVSSCSLRARHRRPLRSARRFRRCRQPLESHCQHTRAAHHLAQSCRPLPTSRRPRTSRRTARRRRPHRQAPPMARKPTDSTTPAPGRAPHWARRASMNSAHWEQPAASPLLPTPRSPRLMNFGTEPTMVTVRRTHRAAVVHALPLTAFL